jgi:predicted extracellular nuclease
MFSRLFCQNVTVVAGLLFLSISSCNNASQPKDQFTRSANAYKGSGEISLVFYNVENLFDTLDNPLTADDEYLPGTAKDWNTQKYQTKLDRLSEVLSKIADGYPTFIGFAEVENEEVLKELANHSLLAEAEYGIIHQDSPDERGIDVGLVYRKTQFTPGAQRFLTVALPAEDRPTRDILYVHGKITKGPEVHIFVNHWPSRGGGAAETAHKRMAAAETLNAELTAIREKDPDANIIIMGDFNDYPGDTSLKHLQAAGIINLMEGLAATGRGSYNYKGDWDFLDQILVSQNLKDGKGFDVAEGSTVAFHFPEMLYTDPKYGDEKPNRTYGGDKYFGGYSDHLPVITVLKY